MPQIIVTANAGESTPVLLRERINPSDFDSEVFGQHLVERLGWAVVDACEVEAEPTHGKAPNEAPTRTEAMHEEPGRVAARA